jgi:hypothetical protein
VAGRETFEMLDGEDGQTKKVEVDIQPLLKKHKRRLLNLAGNIGGSENKVVTDMLVGEIVDYFLTNVVDELQVNGERVKPVGEANERKSLYDALPDLYDEESEEEIDDRLIKLCVKHNPRVASNPTLSQVFARYRTRDDEAGNPTKDGSGKNASSTSEGTEKKLTPVT